MLTTPRVPWFVVVAVLVAAVAVWQQRAKKEATAPVQPPPVLKPNEPVFEILVPARGSAFAPGQPIEHAWTPYAGVDHYQLDFAVPTRDGRCTFDAPRDLAVASITLSHDDPTPCMVWRVRTDRGVATGGSYTVGPPPGCTLPPSAMTRCIESQARQGSAEHKATGAHEAPGTGEVIIDRQP